VIRKEKDSLALCKAHFSSPKSKRVHNDILYGENSYYTLDHQTTKRELSHCIFFNERTIDTEKQSTS